MSREAFEKWWSDPSTNRRLTDMSADRAFYIWQAAQAQAVNQQLLDDIVNLLIAARGAIKLGRGADAYNYIDAAIAAAQEGK